MATPLPKALDAELHDWHSSGCGRLSYYSDAPDAGSGGNGTPILLLHSINAAPSAYEMKPLFEHYRGQRPVYALELPGFGQSERRDRRYDAQLFADAISSFVDEVIGRPTDVVALSTTAEFAARGSLATTAIRSLVLISPTGLRDRPPPGPTAQRRLMRFFQLPGVGAGLYRALTVKPSVRYFLNMGFTGKAPEDLVSYAHRTTQQPGARHAPFYFLSMQLFTADAVNALYRQVKVPVLVLYDDDPNISFERLPEVLDACPDWRAERIEPTLGLPHWEQPAATQAAMDAFWHDVDDG
ncbi:alpha/beta fold hydrolase [Pseudohaliea rubra]|uniref:Putative alpha/beta hydrolase superfamily-like protein n=1 Tax=Pseudohaliea rubra DSM 19751 TaxID=1265313 RepID=A0A095VNR2_9GAMM|nr:alpha/beta hydrolase [Pseudohaliea rubra]KGE03015.1 putative alpha/beta hydrolase superfamily-like protein [Pseudohaliea rubra DSM 19751]